MNVLILGSGGREHALAWKISRSKLLDRLYIAPGNAGTLECGSNIELSLSDFQAIKKAILKHEIGLVVVGPEAPLVEGITDFLKSDESLSGILVVGPGRQGAQLEGSKDFAKDFMVRHDIPTAAYKSISAENLDVGKKFLSTLRPPFVLKADGLAAGKGVLILQDREEAEKELIQMLGGKFGKASQRVVIEEFLSGTELSVFVLTDGKDYRILPEAKDYKRIGEGDTGLNTGGMGAVSPVPFAGREFMEKVEKRIIVPTIQGLRKENIDYKGFIFIGLMNVDGDPFVIEYNVRLGDPETEVVLPRIESDFLELLTATAGSGLSGMEIRTLSQTAVTVMLVSGGYPGDYEKGKVIHGLEKVSGSLVFHAGTTKNSGNEVLTAGGRVLAVSSTGKDMKEALALSYKNAAQIEFDGRYYRRDIGYEL